MRISDWSSDVCSSDLQASGAGPNCRGCTQIWPALCQPSLAGRHAHQLENNFAVDQALQSAGRAAFGRYPWPYPEASAAAHPRKIGRAHVSTPVTHAHFVCRLLLATKKLYTANNNEP